MPPEFELLHRSKDGDGAAFQSADGALLAVWGTDVAESDFLPQVKKQISQDEKEGWKFIYRRLTRDGQVTRGSKTTRSDMSEA
ncbi:MULTISPECIES: hypothetical protein [Mesorhizobium]|uniref:hypothetical protein n=1 Tax=Mesorhizobium sp. TaxID=1871066 RepID=UPI000AECA0DD|nr:MULTISPECIES: hypothetical protein [Mesorhizobium]TIQ26366.1 MAG: hypothetical protein E5X61_22540 [Mesorhizobium sp.]